MSWLNNNFIPAISSIERAAWSPKGLSLAATGAGFAVGGPMGAAMVSGGLGEFGNLQNQDAQYAVNQHNLDQQMEFAQNSLGWKINDAARFGINPLAALGATGTSFSPSFQPGDPGEGVKGFGQDVARALYANKSSDKRLQDYMQSMQDEQLKGAKLDNLMKQSQIAKLNQPGNPPGIPDYATFVDQHGNPYIGPSLDWSESAGRMPGAHVGYWLRNTAIPYIGTLLRMSRDLGNYEQGNEDMLKTRWFWNKK